ncbi:flagellin hook IN motif-containing protein, partial [Campylobacter pinnipediorum]|uniref:flagellin hook IN motif-containing protein n=1 Tax=Campylobacter pinnipediorum TaxID=1965231 RepID=UPI000A55E45A
IIASKAITAGSIVSLDINGVKIGDLDVKANDSNGTLVNAINQVKDQTGVEASIDPQGKLVLTSRDGRAIKIKGGRGADKKDIGKGLGMSEEVGKMLSQNMFIGRLNLVRLDGRDIKISSGNSGKVGAFSVAFSADSTGQNKNGGSEASVSLREIKGQIDKTVAAAMGFQRMMNSGTMTSHQ